MVVEFWVQDCEEQNVQSIEASMTSTIIASRGSRAPRLTRTRILSHYMLGILDPANPLHFVQINLISLQSCAHATVAPKSSSSADQMLRKPDGNGGG